MFQDRGEMSTYQKRRTDKPAALELLEKSDFKHLHLFYSLLCQATKEDLTTILLQSTDTETAVGFHPLS
jgi:hypothetical protein